ncbi:MAG: hypothetical protein Q7R96_01255 [Nanoarchaeota archaeon]|nr:hypothetical protein [Nanoarchaeota archaeon]
MKLLALSIILLLLTGCTPTTEQNTITEPTTIKEKPILEENYYTSLEEAQRDLDALSTLET